MTAKIGFSLRYKLLLLLTAVPLVCLTIYIVIATNLFEKDKIAYVYDSSVSMARSLSSQVRLEATSFLDQAKGFIEGYDFSSKEFNEMVKRQFDQQSRIDALVLFYIKADGVISREGYLNKKNTGALQFLKNDTLVDFARATAQKNGSYFSSYRAGVPLYSIIAQQAPGPEANSKIVFVGLYSTPELSKSFESAALYRSFLVSDKLTLEAGPASVERTLLAKENPAELFGRALESTLPEGTSEKKTSQGKDILIAFSKTGMGGQAVVSVVDKESALMAVNVMIGKSIMFYVALLASTIIVSVFASSKLTQSLRNLHEATTEVSKGNFDIRVVADSNDEIGGLANGFNLMAEKVSELISETAEKARMESELATAHAVQETLFPDQDNEFGPIKVYGHYQSASECGGDWWYCSEIQGRVYLWIGDATGHGAPAALVTSAARSAASVIEGIPGISPSSALKVMNKAIHEVSRGKINMTFFLAAIDVAGGKLTYSNASHEPAYLIKKGQRAPKKKDLLPLMESNGPRLGEYHETDYNEDTIDFCEGDSLVFYTDGVTDLVNEGGKTWGERRFLKSILNSFAASRSYDERAKIIIDEIEAYKGEAPLIDDVTMFVCQFGDVA